MCPEQRDTRSRRAIAFVASALVLAILSACESPCPKAPRAESSEPPSVSNVGQEPRDARGWFEAGDCQRALDELPPPRAGHADPAAHERLACLLHLDRVAALALLADRMDSGSDAIAQAQATVSMAAVCRTDLEFVLRTAFLMDRLGRSVDKQPNVIDAVARSLGLPPKCERELRAEQKAYAEWWNRFVRVKRLYGRGELAQALSEARLLRDVVASDPLLGLWIGRIQFELGNAEEALPDLDEARIQFQAALFTLAADGRFVREKPWRQPLIYDDELNECLLILGKCLVQLGENRDAREELGRIPPWSRHHRRAARLIAGITQG